MAEAAPTTEPDRKQPPAWLVNTIVLVTLVAMVGLSTWAIVGGLQSRAKSEPVPGGVITTGTVVDVVTHHDKGTTYRAVIRFTDRDGRTHTFQGQEGDQQPEAGQRCRVSYDPARPLGAHDLTFNHSSWRWPFWTGIFGASLSLVTTVGTALVLLRRRRDARAVAVPSRPAPAPLAHATGRLVGMALGLAIVWPVALLSGWSVAAPIGITIVALLGLAVTWSRARRERGNATESDQLDP